MTMIRKSKKQKEEINDPVVKFGQQLQKNKAVPKKQLRSRELLERLERGGCDDGFVYYED